MLARALKSVCQTLGPLRSMLALFALAVICMAPFALGETHYHDWRIIPTVVAPTFMVMLAFVLPLDMAMTRVFMSGADTAKTARLRRIIRIEAATLIVILAAWAPFLRSLYPR
ncbi:MAG: hypothetical protein GKR94_08875 [Gammaproteobacteria bacterium]|nr:hypothetical protein [Gammaproteobacteria bacterium]